MAQACARSLRPGLDVGGGTLLLPVESRPVIPGRAPFSSFRYAAAYQLSTGWSHVDGARRCVLVLKLASRLAGARKKRYRFSAEAMFQVGPRAGVGCIVDAIT